MPQNVTLGGDRLGSGNKMKVHLHGYERSTHDLGFTFKTTMAPGTLVPFMNFPALPGDTHDIELNCAGLTHPTIGPLFGFQKIQLDVFEIPIRLYNSLLHNNATGIGMHPEQVIFPQVELTAIGSPATFDGSYDLDNSQINPSSLLSYLDIRGVGVVVAGSSQTRNFNAIPILSYFDIGKQYYANKQEGVMAILHTPAVTIVESITSITINGTTIDATAPGGPVTISSGQTIALVYTGTPPIPETVIFETSIGQLSAAQLSYTYTDATTALVGTIKPTYGGIDVYYWHYITGNDINTGRPSIATFPIENIDNMRTQLLAFSSKTNPFIINTTPVTPIEPYSWIDEITGLSPDEIPSRLSSQELLLLKTYQSDLLNNWLDTEWIDGVGGITQRSSIDVSGGVLTMDAINLSEKVYEYLNRISVSDGTYQAYIRATYDHEHFTTAETPVYKGGLIKEMGFQAVVSNSQSGDQPLGTLAGRGVMTNKHKGGKVVIKVNEPSWIMGLVSITPRLDYSQGNGLWVNLQSLDNLHKPGLDQIGFQDDINEKRAWWSTQWTGEAGWTQTAAGKQPAWINYMTNINVTRGNFAIATNEMFMTLNRRYEPDSLYNIADLTTYIDPQKSNYIFADTTLDAQNFWIQIGVDITSRRKMSAKVMPNI